MYVILQDQDGLAGISVFFYVYDVLEYTGTSVFI